MWKDKEDAGWNLAAVQETGWREEKSVGSWARAPRSVKLRKGDSAPRQGGTQGGLGGGYAHLLWGKMTPEVGGRLADLLQNTE